MKTSMFKNWINSNKIAYNFITENEVVINLPFNTIEEFSQFFKLDNYSSEKVTLKYNCIAVKMSSFFINANMKLNEVFIK
jgi:hypothetical protein